VFDRPWPSAAGRTVWFVEVTRPTLVLGSTQPEGVVDRERAAAAGVDVVRRPTGGGAVLLRPGETVWADVYLPPGDPLAESDVGRAFLWLGRAWARALASVGVAGATVHEGASRAPTAWSATVCFAGLGPGEVTVDGAKVVGISQRRRRDGALFQCGALVGWAPGPLLDLLVLDEETRAAAGAGLGGLAAGTGVEPERLTSAFEAALNGD
jgi:lipoate---protein ligase